MTNGVGRTENTRWQEMYDIVKKLLPLTMEYDSNGVDIYFLNRESYFKAKNVTDVDYAFLETPSGYTLLAPVLETIVHSPLTLPGKEKKLLVFVATDGKVTDEDGKEEVDELKRLLKETRNSDTNYVSFLLCTDERECVEYKPRWDQQMSQVDVTDDYDTETEKTRRFQENPDYPFTYDDYIIKALIDSIHQEIPIASNRERCELFLNMIVPVVFVKFYYDSSNKHFPKVFRWLKDKRQELNFSLVSNRSLDFLSNALDS